jgi:hypothetical protein
MSSELLKQHLKDLDAELKSAETIDEDSEKLLREIIVDAKALIAHKGEFPSDNHATIKDRFADAARHFELSHPSVASILNNVVNTFNNMGI